jgi:hypothetical protein
MAYVLDIWVSLFSVILFHSGAGRWQFVRRATSQFQAMATHGPHGRQTYGILWTVLRIMAEWRGVNLSAFLAGVVVLWFGAGATLQISPAAIA